MRAGAITCVRVAILLGYALIGAALDLGGVTDAELGLMVVLGVICMIAVVLADWINAGVPRDDDLR